MNTDTESQTSPKWKDESLPLWTRKELLAAELERYGAQRKSERPSGSTRTQCASSYTPKGGEHAS